MLTENSIGELDGQVWGATFPLAYSFPTTAVERVIMVVMSQTMGGGLGIAQVAALLGDKSRAAMVTALLDGSRLPASELARIAGVSKSTASAHLGRLVENGLLATERCGRHTYYRVAAPEVASAVEALAVLAPRRRPNSLRSVRRQDELARARLCYDHLAGWLGVSITDALCHRGLLWKENNTFALDEAAWDADPPLGITRAAVRAGRRPIVRACVDWTVRRHHLAGPLGGALARRMIELGWIRRRRDKERVIVLTEFGAGEIQRAFDLDDEQMAAVLGS